MESERIDRRIDAQRRDVTAQHRGGVQVGERRVRRGVGDVVCRHVDRLQRGDRAPLRGRDALLELAHLVGQRRLIAHRARHAPEQRGDLRASLGEPEDVVHEQQHVLALHVAEVFGHGEGAQRDPQADAGRLVHLSEHEGSVGEDAGFGHLQEQVVAFAGSLADAGEHRHAAVLLGLPADHLLDDHGLAHARAAEHADLAALHVGLQQIDDLDAGLQHHRLRLELIERRAVAVDRPAIGRMDLVLGGIEWLAEHVVHVPQDALADGNADR